MFFSVLPFSLASVPYVFTKLLRPLMKLWRSRGLKSLMYLDDGIVAVNGKEVLKRLDNQNVVRILQVGSRRPHLQEQAKL